MMVKSLEEERDQKTICQTIKKDIELNDLMTYLQTQFMTEYFGVV